MKPFASRVTIALSDHQVWIHMPAVLGTRPVHSAVIGKPGAEWPELTDAVRSWLAGNDIVTCTADVKVLPPLVMARVLEMPRLTNDEIQFVVEQSPERYFPIGHEAHLVATLRLTHRRGSPARVLAAAVSQTNANAIRKALADGGVIVNGMGCAHDVWLGAGRKRHARLVVAANGGVVDVLEMTHGKLENVRRVHLAALADYKLDAVRPGEFCVRQRGAGRLVLRDSIERTRVLAQQWRSVAIRGAIAALLLVAAAGLETRHQRTELAAIRDARAALRAQLTDAIAVKHGAERSATELADLQQLERHSERWSRLLTGIARQLPLDTRVLSLRATADTLVVEGVSHDPQLSFMTLRESGLFESLGVASPVVSERNADGETRLRFRFQGSLRPTGGP